MRSPGGIALTLVCVALLAAAAPAMAEDVVVVFKTDGPGGAGTETQYYSAKMMRTSEGQTDTLFNYESGMITSIDHGKQEYSQITLEDIEAAMEAMNAKMEQARAQMEAMPAAIRERMAGMMGGEVVVTKGGTREVAGYATQEYIVTMGESLTMKVWKTTEVTLPVPVDAMKKLAAFTGPMTAMANNPMFQGFGQLAEKMREIDGITLADQTSVSMMGRGSESSREATEVRRGPIPASDLDVAALASGYKKVESTLAQLGKR